MLIVYKFVNSGDQTDEAELDILGMGKRALKKMRRARKKTKKRGNDNDERIIGGQNAQKGVWKWIVHLPILGCAGTIIGNNWVLTAAHCCHGPNPNAYTTIVNQYDTELDQGDTEIYYPEQIIRHPDYEPDTTSHDYCLLRYATPITFDANVAAACLPTQSVEPSVNATCFTAGWGLTDQNIPTSTSAFLQEVQVEIIDRTLCNGNVSYNGTIDSTMICAGSMAGGEDSCQGDSGGPLICEESGVPVLHGVVSYGEGCGLANKPGVYASVNNIVTWITDIVGGQHTNETYSNHTTQVCGENLIGYDGVIASSNYPANYSSNQQCTWTITVPTGKLVELTFHDMDIEYESECLYDRIQIIDGYHPIWYGRGSDGQNGRALDLDEDYDNWYWGDDLIEHYKCGNSTETAPYQSSSNTLTLVFVSDLDTAGRGFNASYRAVQEENRFDDNCGITVVNGREGNFTGPLAAGKPGTIPTYPPGTDCQWTVDVGTLSDGEVIQVWFEKFDLEESPNCEYDSLLLFAVDEFGNRNVADDRKLCGQNLPPILTFTEAKLQIHFNSDTTDQYEGFKLFWNVKSTIIEISDWSTALTWTVVTRPRNYEEAETDCEAFGLQLVKMNSEISRKALLDALAKHAISGEFYIGLERNTMQPLLFQWTDGEPVGAKFYQNWANGHPQGGVSKKDCASFNTSNKANRGYTPGRWLTTDCEDQKSYICGMNTTTTLDCPVVNLPANTQIDERSCRGNLPGWRGSSCLLTCESGFYIRPLTDSKVPKKIKANCMSVSKRMPEQFMWQIKSKIQFECQKDCPYPHAQDKSSVRFIERTWDVATNQTNTALLVSFQYPSKTQSDGWSVILKFARYIIHYC